VVTNIDTTFENHLEVSEIAAELKEYAKGFPKSLYVVDRRRRYDRTVKTQDKNNPKVVNINERSTGS